MAASLFFLIMLAHDELVAAALERRFGESRPLLERINVWGFALPGVAIPLLIVWRMTVARRWRTVVFAVGAIWLLFLGVPLIDLAIAVARVGWDVVAANIGLFVHHAGPGIVVALGASFYLLGSRRVAATYSRFGEVDRVFD